MAKTNSNEPFMMKIPKVFISYSHDSQDHKKWVHNLAMRLYNNGIDAVLDQFDLHAGDDIPHFMETNLVSADKILMICTDKYVEKANKGEGGVGYEKMIVTSSLMKHINENKVIPIIRQNLTSEVPIFLKSKLYIDFSNQDAFEINYDELVRVIHESPLFVKPPIGNNPYKPVEKLVLEGDVDFLHSCLKSISRLQENRWKSSVEDLANKMRISLVMAEAGVIKLVKLGYLEWDKPNSISPDFYLTEKGKLYILDNNLSDSSINWFNNLLRRYIHF